jgi:hypothetical protein
VKTIVLLDGQTPVTEEAANGLKRYLDAGGKTIMFTSNMELLGISDDEVDIGLGDIFITSE